MEKDLRQNERTNISLEVTVEFSSGKREVRISDLSMSGCFIDSIAPVAKGESVVFTVRVPTTGEQLKLNGEVVYIFPNSGFGIRFTDLTEEEQSIIKRLIEERGDRP
jgi:Tfp pilus assembly protein PilZ